MIYFGTGKAIFAQDTHAPNATMWKRWCPETKQWLEQMPSEQEMKEFYCFAFDEAGADPPSLSIRATYSNERKFLRIVYPHARKP